MKSLWEINSDMPLSEQLKGDIKTEVLIIGGGAVGLLTAYFLDKSGVDYILVEKGRICGGVTKNTTAKITFQHGLIYAEFAKSRGLNNAEMYLESNRKALEKYQELCKDIDCGFEIKNNYVYSVNSPEKLEDELEALHQIGYDAGFIKDMPIPIKTAGAVCFPHQAQFNPLQFFSQISKNLKISENTFVREMQGNTAVTDYGKIYADKVIVTTHFPFINKHGSYFLKLYQHRSYVIALGNAPDVDGMYVDEDKKGLSFRNYGDYLLLGGGSHKTGKDGGNWAELREFAKAYYPESTEKFFWATQDCMSLDSIPYIGNYSKKTTDLYVASGFNKWGMTGAMVSAMLLCDLINGKKNEYSELYNPSRSILHPQLFVNGFESAVNLLTISKKRCPHLGCALKWNKAEHSWDCPCHGSRFSEKGKLLENPANGDMNN